MLFGNALARWFVLLCFRALYCAILYSHDANKNQWIRRIEKHDRLSHNYLVFDLLSLIGNKHAKKRTFEIAPVHRRALLAPKGITSSKKTRRKLLSEPKITQKGIRKRKQSSPN